MINKKVETRSQAVVTQTYISPLPPASEAEKYEKLLKGSVDRIFTMAEEQQKKNYQRDFTLLANDELKIKKSYQVAMVAMAFAFTLCGISVLQIFTTCRRTLPLFFLFFFLFPLYVLLNRNIWSYV